MAIISTTMLSDRIPGTADATALSNAVSKATAFVNTYASKHYDPFDDYLDSPETILAPDEIGEICLQVAEAYYYLNIGQTSRDGNDRAVWKEILDGYRAELKEIHVAPTWETQAISLNSNNCMIIGSRTLTGGMWPRVIPQTAQVISNTSSVWLYPDDWFIRKGGMYDDEYYDAWYFDVNRGSSVAGTLRYMRTYRCDGYDYLKYSTNTYGMQADRYERRDV